MEKNLLEKLLNGHALNDDALDAVVGGTGGGVAGTGYTVEELKQMGREMGYTEEQINALEQQAREMGLIP